MEKPQPIGSKENSLRRILGTVGSLEPSVDNDNWLKEIRGTLGLIATVIATMLFQMGINPLGEGC